MKRAMWYAAGVIAVVAAGGTAAPVPKAGEKLPPPTPEQWKQAQHQLRQIAIAIHNFHDAHGHLPADKMSADRRKPLLSWRVLILPWIDGAIEEVKLYQQFKLDEPWDGVNNKQLVEKMPKLFAPVRVKAKAGDTFYRGFDGPGRSSSVTSV